jgi:HAD superfamily hydrolase (TIGR01484 family)
MFVSVFAKLFKNLNVTKLEPNDIKDVFKLVIYTYLPNVRKIGEYLSTKYKDMNEIVEHGPYCLEVTCKGVNKGYAISQIAESLNVPLDEVAIIGDSNNDVMAARVVGMSFAVTKKSKVLNELATHKYRKSKHCVANAINEHLLVE